RRHTRSDRDWSSDVCSSDLHGGEMSPAQTGGLRPAPGWAEHRLPIPGLYQTGSTTHPGASVSAGPGRNAAAVMLKDFGTSIEERSEERRVGKEGRARRAP